MIKLHGWQSENVEFIEKNKYVLIADEMGLGKTFSALACVKKNELYPCLIICPKSLKINWEREIDRIDPTKSVDVLKGNMSHIEIKNERFSHDYSIIQYDSKKLIQTMPKVRSIILDEVHYLKNFKAQRTVTTQKYIREKSTASHVMGLSGTPLLNKGTEIFTVVNVLHCNVDGYGNVPENIWDSVGGGLITHKEFFGNGSDKFVYPLYDKWDEPDRITGYMVYENKMKELNQLLINRGIMIRHTKSLLYDRKLLDPIHVENIILDTPIGYRNELEKLYSSGGGFSVGQLQKLRVWLAVAKVKFVIEHTENIMENYKDKVIIFGNYKAPLKILADHFNTISHDGDIKNPTERQELIDNFMIHKTQNVLIMSIATGGVGLNLTEANHVVLNDYPYSPSQLDQAISRAHRLGQKQQVTVHYLTAKNTIDEDVVKILTNKSNISSAIIDGTNYPFDKDGIERTIAEKVEKMIRSQKSKKTKTPKFHQKK